MSITQAVHGSSLSDSIDRVHAFQSDKRLQTHDVGQKVFILKLLWRWGWSSTVPTLVSILICQPRTLRFDVFCFFWVGKLYLIYSRTKSLGSTTALICSFICMHLQSWILYLNCHSSSCTSCMLCIPLVNIGCSLTTVNTLQLYSVLTAFNKAVVHAPVMQLHTGQTIKTT